LSISVFPCTLTDEDTGISFPMDSSAIAIFV
jgi:hypothetical protein